MLTGTHLLSRDGYGACRTGTQPRKCSPAGEADRRQDRLTSPVTRGGSQHPRPERRPQTASRNPSDWNITCQTGRRALASGELSGEGSHQTVIPGMTTALRPPLYRFPVLAIRNFRLLLIDRLLAPAAYGFSLAGASFAVLQATGSVGGLSYVLAVQVAPLPDIHAPRRGGERRLPTAACAASGRTS
jgi:hypothetical protein